MRGKGRPIALPATRILEWFLREEQSDRVPVVFMSHDHLTWGVSDRTFRRVLDDLKQQELIVASGSPPNPPLHWGTQEGQYLCLTDRGRIALSETNEYRSRTVPLTQPHLQLFVQNNYPLSKTAQVLLPISAIGVALIVPNDTIIEMLASISEWDNDRTHWKTHGRVGVALR